MSKISEFDIASIAEGILLTDEKVNKKTGKTLTKDSMGGIVEVTAPDVSKIEADLKYRDKVLEQAFGIAVKPRSEGPTKEVVKHIIKEETKKVETNPQEYVVRLLSLIKEAKQLVDEMTACGMIGVNMAGPGIKKKEKKLSKHGLAEKLRKKYKL